MGTLCSEDNISSRSELEAVIVVLRASVDDGVSEDEYFDRYARRIRERSPVDEDDFPERIRRALIGLDFAGARHCAECQCCIASIIDQHVLQLVFEDPRAFPSHPTPIAKLPAELLTMVFWFLTIPDLIRATHVCRHWSEAALSRRSLWTRVYARDAVQLSELLARSADLPIFVDLLPLRPTSWENDEDDVRTYQDSFATRCMMVRMGEIPLRALDELSTWSENQLYLALMPHMHRVRTLSIREFDSDGCSSLNALLSLPAPKLELLILDPVERFVVEPTGNDGTDYVLLDHLFADHAPNLDMVYFFNVAPPSRLTACPALHSVRTLVYDGPEGALAGLLALSPRSVPEVIFHQPRGPPRHARPEDLVHPARPVFAILPPPHAVTTLALRKGDLAACSGDAVQRVVDGIGAEAPRAYLGRVLRDSTRLFNLHLDEEYAAFVCGVRLPELDLLVIYAREAGEAEGRGAYIPAFLSAAPPVARYLGELRLVCPLAMGANPALLAAMEEYALRARGPAAIDDGTRALKARVITRSCVRGQ